MKIELKRFTTNARLSEETTAFAADVWVDGKKVGWAKNDGRGGATMVHIDRSVKDQVEAHGKALIPAEYKAKGFMSYDGAGAEWIVDQLVETLLRQKEEKKFTRIDAKEKARCAQHGLKSARYRLGDTWLWFAFKLDEDPKTMASTLAGRAVDELVVLS